MSDERVGEVEPLRGANLSKTLYHLSMRSWLVLSAALVLAPACRKKEAQPGGVARLTDERPGSQTLAHPKPAPPEPLPGKPLVRCFPTDASGAPPRRLAAVLDRAATLYDQEDFAASLVCAEEAARIDPRSVEAHHDRAAALEELDRLDEAALAFTRALALDPDDPETLAAAANLYVNRMPAPSTKTGPKGALSTLSDADRTEIGLEYARRGTARMRRISRRGNNAKQAVDKSLVGRLALIEGQALNDLGRPREALPRLEAAELALPGDLHVRFEHGMSLFDLCRFTDAKRAFSEVLERDPKDAWAHHHLGLVLERLGDESGAARELGAARVASPENFKPPVEITAAEFAAVVRLEAARLPAKLAADLKKVALETADLPELTDLTADEPPLSPTILGLFRGAPLGDGPESEPRTIVLYRKNLARAVATKDELVSEVRITLHHELGHLRGEDDEALRARGLE